MKQLISSSKNKNNIIKEDIGMITLKFFKNMFKEINQNKLKDKAQVEKIDL